MKTEILPLLIILNTFIITAASCNNVSNNENNSDAIFTSIQNQTSEPQIDYTHIYVKKDFVPPKNISKKDFDKHFTDLLYSECEKIGNSKKFRNRQYQIAEQLGISPHQNGGYIDATKGPVALATLQVLSGNKVTAIAVVDFFRKGNSLMMQDRENICVKVPIESKTANAYIKSKLGEAISWNDDLFYELVTKKMDELTTQKEKDAALKRRQFEESN